MMPSSSFFNFHNEKSTINHRPSLTMSSNTTLQAEADPTAEPPSELSQEEQARAALMAAFQVETAHKEKDFKYKEEVKDIIMGASDGLTVPFALTAGLSS